MTPTTRAAWILAAVALAALVLPPGVVALAALALLAAVAVDLMSVRRTPRVERRLPAILSRGVGSRLRIEAEAPGARRLRVRQPAPPDLEVEPREDDWELEARVTPRRRGRHPLPRPATRTEGQLGLGAAYRRPGEDGEVVVYPDLPAARRLALAVRQGAFREAGRLRRGPLGLGTEFEQVRDYLPDDDVRQVNWRATARLGRPMSNQYRVEQDRDVVCLVDCGRLMAAPVAGRTRLDAAVDAVAALAAVADDLGDRIGCVAFDARVLRQVRPRRGGGEGVLRTLFDVEPSSADSDFEAAFRRVEGTKRALVVVFTDLLEEAAARPLLEAVPVLARRHALVVASVRDPDLAALVRTPPTQPADVYTAAAAVDVLDAREAVAARLRATGAQVIEAAPERLGEACVRAYLTAKSRARL